MAYDGSIRIDTSIDTSGFNEGISKVSGTASEKLDKVSASADKVSSSASNAGSKFSSAGEKMSKTGAKMTLGLTTPLVALGRSAVKTGADFEDTMSQTAGALNIPMSQMGSMRSLALKMGADTQFSAKEAGEAMVELAKGGLTEAQIKGGALKATMDLAASSGMELGTSANVVVQAMGAFGLSANKSSVAANALAGAAAASSTDVEPLTQGLAQCGAQAHLAGWNIQDTTAVLGAFADAGVNGADAGTSLKTMLQRLSAPTGKAAKLMNEYGIKVRNSNGTMKSASEIAQILHDKLGKLSPAARDVAMQTIFGSDASRAAAIMMNNGATGLAKYTKATYDQTSASRLADSQMGDTNKAIEQMKGSLETAGIALSTILNPIVRDVAGKIQDLANKFTSLPAPVQKVILTIAGLAAAAGPAIVGFGKLASGIGAIQKLLGRLGAGAKVVKDVSGSVSTLGKVGSGVGKVFKGLGSVFKTVGSGIGSAVKALGSGLKVVGAGLLKGIKGIGTAVKGLFTLLAANPAALIVIAIAAIVVALIAAYTHCKAFRDGVNAVFGAIGNFFKTIGAGIAGFFSKTLPSALAGVGKFFASIGSSIGNFVTKTVPAAFSALPGLVGGVWNKVKTGASAAWGNICTVVSGKANDIKGKAISAFNTLKTNASGVWGNMKSTASSIWGGIHSAVSTQANNIKNGAITAFNNLKNGAASIWGNVKSTAANIWGGISGVVGTLARKARDGAIGAFNGLKSGVHNIMGHIGPIIRSAFNDPIGFITSLPGKMFHWGSEIIGHLVSGIRSMIGNIGKAVGDVANKIKSFLHFSIPDEGPLRNIMDWPRDMMQQYGGGITDNLGYVTAAVSAVAKNMVLRPDASAVHRMVSDMYAAVGAESAGVSARVTASAAFSAAQFSPHISPIVQPAPVMVQTDDRPIVMDGKMVGRVLAPHINEEFAKSDIKVKRGG
jgi:TP901 family phage tail tape measure protein